MAISGNGGGPFRFDALRRVLESRSGCGPAPFQLVTPELSGFDGGAAAADAASSAIGIPRNPDAPRRRTVGGSSRFRDWRLEDWSREIEAACGRIDGPIVLYGHGVGGALVLDVLRRGRLVVDGVILHAPVGANLRNRLFPRLMRLPGVRQVARTLIASRWLRPLWRRRFFQERQSDETVTRFFQGYRDCQAFARMFDLITAEWFESLPAFRIPALLLWGGRERLLEPAQARAFLRVLPRSSIEVVPEWTHFPMIDDPERTVDELASGISRLLGTNGSEQPGPSLPRLGDRALPPRACSKALVLDVARRCGIPVPPGFLVPDELFDDDASDRPRVVAAVRIATLELSRELDRSVDELRFAVRSSFDLEDRAGFAGAGAFRTELDLSVAEVADAALRVRASGQGRAQRRDVLVQQMVDASHAGVLFTERDYEDDLVEWTRGTGDRVVREGGESLQLPKLRGFETRGGPRAAESWQTRLQELARDLVRRGRSIDSAGLELGSELDLEWADDGERCWLLQARPITAKPRRDGLFTVANHKEILPELPSVLMTSILEQEAGNLYAHYRRFDPELPISRPFLRTFHGRPRIDLSLLVDTMRILGLPSRLVTDSIGGGSIADHPFRAGRAIRKWRSLSRLAIAQFTAAARSRRLARRLRSPARISSFEGFGREFGGLYTDLVHAMMDLTGAMAPPLAVLRRLGWLEVLARGHRTVTTRLFESVAELQEALPDDAKLRAELIAGRWPEGHAFESRLDAFLERFGHRGVFESDIASPRFREEPAPLLRSLVNRSPETGLGRPPESVPVRARERAAGAPIRRLLARTFGAPMWWAARGPLAAREQLRDQAMHGFAQLRADLCRLATEAHRSQLLPDPVAVFDLDLSELAALDRGQAFSHGEWRERRAEIAKRRALELPDLFSSRDPMANRDAPVPDGAIRGLGLVSGVVEGRAFRATSPTADWPTDLDGAVVLIAPAVDAGWIPLLARADAVVVETGGDLSHGSIVLREVGLVSVTNARGAMRLSHNQRVRVDGSAGVVETLD